ncbi:O-antigen ligase family protein [Methylomicrobium sp. Wu6]|uniref:O-antigen ligase family protein n=1 Tax=Methylomicrobium sp. Wu6 TaxID=3107928 RepID=UPI002DD670AE|nr:O-antigen ligase family protein [Methylomicrobium sp. Wu6]MEC4747783.1 O-antigen ligase family protein [Methylomicrobium sp. Wu6]
MKMNGSVFFRWMERSIYVVFLAVFIISPLPLGSNRGWAFLALSAVFLMLLTGYLIIECNSLLRDAAKQHRQPFGLCAFLLLLVAVWMWAQTTLELPAGWMSKLSPVTQEIYTSAQNILEPAQTSRAFPISLEPGKTIDQAMLTLACFAMVILMQGLINSRQRLVQFCYVIVLSGVFQALYGTVMVLTGMEYLLFVPKKAYIGNATGTFVNRNHLAGYLEMTLAVGIGLLLGSRKVSDQVRQHWRGVLTYILQTLMSPIAILRCLLVIMVIGLLMTHSRMGNAGFFNALLITSVIALVATRQFRRPGFISIILSIVTVDILLLGTWFDIGKVINRIENTGLDHETRDEAVQYVMQMLPDFWLAGTGAGTFAYIFPKYSQFVGGFYDYAHNDYLQLWVELGVIGCIPLAGLVMFGLLNGWSLLRRSESRLLRGVGFASIMGTVSLLIHSTVDFNLQIPANILLFVALLALPQVARQALTDRTSI